MSHLVRASVRTSSTAGDGLFANQSIVPGDVILSIQRPALTALDSVHLVDTCANCFTESSSSSITTQRDAPTTVHACTGCHFLRYCSKKCQSQSWKREHKLECSTLRNAALSGTLPNAARAVLSLLKRYQHGQLQANQWDEFMSLESHVKKIKAQGKSGEDTFDVISYGILQLLGAEKAGFGLQLVQQCLGMVMTNALTIVTPVFDPVGMCVDPLISKANHSCDPNAVVVFDGPRLSLRSLRPINSNEEIFISYIDSTDPRSRRQEQLMTRYHFICVCSKCQNDQIHIPGDNDQLTTLPPVYDPAFTHAEIEGWVILEKVKKSDPSSAISMLETALFGLQKENIRPLTRQPGPSLRQQLLVNFLSAGRYLDALHQGFLIYFGVDPTLFPEPFHPVRVVHNWTLANLIVYITGEQHDGRVIELQRRGVDWGVALYGIVKEVLENVAKSHGPESRFADAVKTAAAQMLKDATSGAGVELDAFDDRLGEQRVLLRQLFLNGAVQ